MLCIFPQAKYELVWMGCTSLLANCCRDFENLITHSLHMNIQFLKRNLLHASLMLFNSTDVLTSSFWPDEFLMPLIDYRPSGEQQKPAIFDYNFFWSFFPALA